MDRAIVAMSADGPQLMFMPDPRTPVTVVITYQVDDSNVADFQAATRRVELSRRRTGAYLWRLERLGSDTRTHSEKFSVRPWLESQLSASERWTAYDAGNLKAVQRWRTHEEQSFGLDTHR